MDFKTFMLKLDGKRNETTVRQTTASGSLDVQSIIRIAREYGYSMPRLEERSDFPNGIVEAFRAGQRDTPVSAMGLHRQYPSYHHELDVFHKVGRYEQSRGNTPSSVQEELPAAPEPAYVESEWSPTLVYYGHSSRNMQGEWTFEPEPTVGGATGGTLSGTEPTGGLDYVPPNERYAAQRRLCETIGEQEGGVQSVRDERESGERSTENTRESLGRSMERFARGEI